MWIYENLGNLTVEQVFWMINEKYDTPVWRNSEFWFGSVHISCTCSHSGQCAGLLWDTLGYPWVSAFLCLFAVASRFLGNGFHSWWSGRPSSVKTVQSSHLLILSDWTPILTTTMLRKPWKTTIYTIYIYMFRHKLRCLSRELVGNMGNYWKP